MKEIPLRDINDDIVAWAQVSDLDFDYANQYRWHRTVYGYAVAGPSMNVKIWMHRFIYARAFGPIKKLNIDHKDRNRLNNQRENLREATTTENVLNRDIGKNNTTGYYGVRLDKRKKGRIRYQAYTTCLKRGGWLSIGYFDDIRDAAIGRDIWMENHHGDEFLVKNIPDVSAEDRQRVDNLLKNPKKRDGKSRFRGLIYFPKRNKCWHARIAKDGKQYGVGYHLTEEEAALAYNKKAIELYGNEAKLNIL